MSDSQIRTIERFFQMVAQPAQTAAINTALRLGLLEALEEGQKTDQELADQCDLHLQGTRSLLQILIHAGLVEQFDEYFALSQASRLTSRNLWAIMFDQWTQLESALMKQPSENDEPEYERERQREKQIEQFKVVHSQIQWASTGVALKVNQALGIGSERTAMNVLDLGCGSAIYSMAIAHHDAQARIQLVDDGVGLARARATVNSMELGDRVEMLESEELVFAGHNSSFDLVLITDQIHVRDQQTSQRILTTAFRTLKPGGEVAIVDIFSGQERGDLNCHLFQLQLLTGTGQSTLSLEQVQQLLTEVGFREIQYTELPVAPYTHGLVLAAKPLDTDATDLA